MSSDLNCDETSRRPGSAALQSVIVQLPNFYNLKAANKNKFTSPVYDSNSDDDDDDDDRGGSSSSHHNKNTDIILGDPDKVVLMPNHLHQHGASTGTRHPEMLDSESKLLLCYSSAYNTAGSGKTESGYDGSGGCDPIRKVVGGGGEKGPKSRPDDDMDFRFGLQETDNLMHMMAAAGGGRQHVEDDEEEGVEGVTEMFKEDDVVMKVVTAVKDDCDDDDDDDNVYRGRVAKDDDEDDDVIKKEEQLNMMHEKLDEGTTDCDLAFGFPRTVVHGSAIVGDRDCSVTSGGGDEELVKRDRTGHLTNYEHVVNEVDDTPGSRILDNDLDSADDGNGMHHHHHHHHQHHQHHHKSSHDVDVRISDKAFAKGGETDNVDNIVYNIVI